MPGLGKETFDSMKSVENAYITYEMVNQTTLFRLKGAQPGDVPGVNVQETPPKPSLYHSDDLATLRILRDMKNDVNPNDPAQAKEVAEYTKQYYQQLQQQAALRNKSAYLGKVLENIDQVAKGAKLSDAEKERVRETLTEAKRRGDAMLRANKTEIDNSVREYSNKLKGVPTITSNGVVQYAGEPVFTESKYMAPSLQAIEGLRNTIFSKNIEHEFGGSIFNISKDGTKIEVGGMTYEFVDETKGTKNQEPVTFSSDAPESDLRAIEYPQQQTVSENQSGLLAIEYPQQQPHPSIVPEEPEAIEIPEYDFVMVDKEEIDLSALKDPTPNRAPTWRDSVTDFINSAVAFGKTILQGLGIIKPDLPTLSSDNTLDGPDLNQPEKKPQVPERKV